MKNFSKYLILILFIFGSTQCDYDRVDLNQCPDDTNPDCPCPNPSNPDCTSTLVFNNLIPISEITGCSSIGINEVLELKNEAGYMLVGRCDAKSLVLHVDKDATQVICVGTFQQEPDFNFFTSIARIEPNNRLVATGYTLNSGANNSNFFNFLISSAACDAGDKFTVDNTTPTPGVNQPWDNGETIIDDANSDDVIVAGKWEGSPSIIRLSDAENMATSNIENMLVLDSLYFKTFAGVDIVSVSGSPVPGHTITKIIQLSDGGFLGTGFVDAIDGADFEKRAFLVKTSADFSTTVLRTYEFSLPYANSWGLDLMEVGGSAAYAMVGVAFNGQNPPALSNATFPIDYPRSSFDGFIYFANKNDLGSEDTKNWLASSSEDLITCIIGKNGPNSSEFYVAGLATGSSNSSNQIRVKGYQNNGTSIESTDVDLTFEQSNEMVYPVDMIKIIGKNEYLIVANTSDVSGNSTGIRMIRIKPE